MVGDGRVDSPQIPIIFYDPINFFFMPSPWHFGPSQTIGQTNQQQRRDHDPNCKHTVHDLHFENGVHPLMFF